mgnify:CR=1 FL=1
MNAHVTAKFTATALSLVMVVFSVGAPFAQAELEAPVTETVETVVETTVEEMTETETSHEEEAIEVEVETEEVEMIVEAKAEAEAEASASGEDASASASAFSFSSVSTQQTERVKRCSDFGFDFKIAKAEFDNGGYHFEFIKSGYNVTVNGDAHSAHWTANPAVAGVVGKAATSYDVLSGGTSGTVSKSDIGSGKHGISHILWCGNDDVTPVVKCEISASPIAIVRGESTELTWTSTGVTAATIDNGVGTVNPNGSLTVTPLETTTYTFTGQGADTNVQCPITIKVEQPQEKECKLIIEKEVNRATAKPGDTLTYSLNIKNIGTADCTGGGVRIVDELDNRLTFVDASYSTNLSGGYNNTHPLFENGTVRFNGHTLTPGESGSMTIKAKVKTPNQCGNFEIPNKAKATARELNNFKNWVYSDIVKTTVENECDTPEEPVCPFSPQDGRTVVEFDGRIRSEQGMSKAMTDVVPVNLEAGTYTVELVSWDGYVGRKNTTQPLEQWTTILSNANGEIAESNAVSDIPDGVDSATVQEVVNTALVVSEDVTGVKAMHVYVGSGKTPNSVNPICAAFDKEPEQKAPSCNMFTATPNKFTNGTGGEITLTWETTNVDSVTIDNGIGAVTEDGATTTNVSADTTFVLTATLGNDSVTCPAVVVVEEPEEPNLSCDSFSASPTNLPRGGGEVNLVWTTTGASKVSINNGIGNVDPDGDTTINVTEDTQFTLTIEDLAGNRVQCDASVDVASGGGGGGSSSPRCELEISDRRVKTGQPVTITWDNTRVNEMAIEDNRGNVIVDTEKDSSIDEDEGSIVVRPTRDTEYSMTVTRGSRERVCRVEVEIEDEVTVIESRTQEPLVAGIALTSVPYTGFEAGPFLTFIFYALLALWAAIVAYFLVVRERTVLGISLVGSTKSAAPVQAWEDMVDEMHAKVDTETDVVFAADTTPSPVISPQLDVPSNLPTGEAPVFGYEALNEQLAPIAEEELNPMTELENAAHAEQALLSSDALNYFMENHADATDRIKALQTVIAAAKAAYPTDGGWLVLNLDRVRQLETSTVQKSETHFTPNTRVGASSLAEAIVSGNVAAAYEMIGHRPMFALADAASDLDAIYRTRKGMEATASDLLLEQSAQLSDGQIEAMISALASALDGAYDNEEAAVKMAVMKAIKASA